MFDNAQKAEYTAIQAPAHLKKRIANTMARPRMNLQVWTSVAASIALITIVSLFSFQLLTPKKIALSYQGNAITQQGVAVLGEAEKAVAFGAKTIVPSGIPLFVQAVKDTKVSVSGGSIQRFGADGELLSVATDLTLDAPSEIRWDISFLPTGNYTLTLADQIYEIRIDAENGKMNIYKK